MPAPEDDAAFYAAREEDNGAALKALFAGLDAKTAKAQITYKHPRVCGAAEFELRGWVGSG